jgi:hypothetical protein
MKIIMWQLMRLGILLVIPNYKGLEFNLLKLDDWGFESWQGLGISLFTNASRPVSGTT